MKRSWLITILLILALLGGGVAVLLLPQVVPANQCSAIYQKYAAMEGVDATFIKNYKVNDTVTVNVTILEAKTDSSWIELQSDFNVPVIPEEFKELIENMNTIDCRLAPKNKYNLPMDTIHYNNDAVAVSRSTKTISIFHLKKNTPIDDIFIPKFKET